MDIGPAAGGQALSLQPRVFLIPPEQGLDKRAVGGDVVGRALTGLKSKSPGLKSGPGHAEAVFLGGAQGHPAVKEALQPGVRDLQQGEGHRQRL